MISNIHNLLKKILTKNSLTSQTFFSFASQLIRAVVLFISSIIIVRSIGVSGQGQYAYYLLFITTLGSYLHLGMSNSNFHFFKDKRYTRNEVYNTNITFLVIIFIIFTFVSAILYLTDNYFVNNNLLLLFLVLFYVLILLFTNNIKQYYIQDKRIRDDSKFLIISLIIKLVIMLTAFILETISIEIIVISDVIYLLLYLFLLVWNFDCKYSMHLNTGLVIEQLKFGIIATLAILAMYLNYRVDQFMIRELLSVEMLGVYSILVMFSERILMIPVSISNAFRSKIYNQSKDGLKSETLKVTRITVLITIIILIPIAGLYLLFPLLYGNDMSGYFHVYLLLLVSNIFIVMIKIGNNYAFRRGEPQVYLMLASLGLVINLILNYYAIPRYELLGASIASLISYLIIGIGFIAYVLRGSDSDE